MPSSTHSIKDRLIALFVALLLGYPFVLGPIRQVWKDHCLVKDRQPGTAMIIREHWAGHDVVVYEYRVGRTVYTGQSRRNRRDPKYGDVRPGEKSPVYYSLSHPWISSFDPPDYVGIDGLPVIVLVWFIEACLLTTVFKPDSKWALDPASKQDAPSVGVSTLGREGFADFSALVGYAILIVLGMVATEIGVNFLLGRR